MTKQPSKEGEEPPYRYLEGKNKKPKVLQRYIGVIDAGTERVRFSVYSPPNFKLITKAEVPVKTFTPNDGWFEQDPRDIIAALNKSSFQAFSNLLEQDFTSHDIATLGITNQRETIILWDRSTGEPLYNAILWKDIRSAKVIDEVLDQVPGRNKNYFKQICGLPLSPYFSAPKIRWLMQNVPAVRRACQDNRCLAGTVDCWILWKLTKGTLHITDVSNASRTFLMNLHSLKWDKQLLALFSIDVKILPEIRSSSEIYGRVYDVTSEFYGMRISGILANQHASLLGQLCTKPGDAKNTYGSGCFLLCNTGTRCLVSKYGLITTVAYQLGPNAPPIYALEGAVAVAGHALDWLHQQVRIIPDLKQVEPLARSANLERGGGVYFVPAFTGLYSPYWRKDARGIICGITSFTTKSHIVRAALEAICYQVHDILECKHIEGVFKLRTLYADGELTANNFLMQLQADLGGITVIRSPVQEAAALGVAICAAQADGISLFEFASDVDAISIIALDTFSPKTTYKERKLRYNKWRRAVESSLAWAVDDISMNRRLTIESATRLNISPLYDRHERHEQHEQHEQHESKSYSSYNFVNSIPNTVYIALSSLILLHTIFKHVSK